MTHELRVKEREKRKSIRQCYINLLIEDCPNCGKIERKTKDVLIYSESNCSQCGCFLNDIEFMVVQRESIKYKSKLRYRG